MTTRQKLLFVAVLVLVAALSAWFVHSEMFFRWVLIPLANLADRYPREFIGVGLILMAYGAIYVLFYVPWTPKPGRVYGWKDGLAHLALYLGMAALLWGGLALSYHR